jgi:hypothetical protein
MIMIYLVLDPACLHLIIEYLCTGFLGLCFVYVLHEHALVLEHIPF